MKKQYYIIGSGGFAKEVFFLAEETIKETAEFKGFIDFKPTANYVFVRNRELPVLEERYFLENVSPSEEIAIYMGIGDPKLLNSISKKFENYNFPNLIHSNFVGDKQSILFGRGNIITAGCVFTVDIEVGSFNVFNLNTTIGHDTKIGNCNVFNPGVNISGSVTIESNNLFGTNATVLQLVTIGNNNILGASSLANKVILDDCVMVGVPAKKMER